ncbi:MAG TPA: phosphoribosylamine--glycine ligase, partial [bacterium]|nr:phosphoribosylamine--glycine ligase [bacterium]
MKVLIIGSGGREHALALAVSKSPAVGKIYCAPGNGGTSSVAENVNVKADDIDGLLKFAKENGIGLTIVGPEIPLVMGMVDLFEAENLKVFGPSEAGAQLEGSKIFTKNLLKKNGIPTADFGEFDGFDAAEKYIKANKKYPVV